MNLMQKGVCRLIYDCLKVKENERVMLITDNSSKEIGQIITKELTNHGAEVTILNMESYGERPIVINDDFVEAIKNSDISILVADKFDGELEKFRTPLLNLIAETNTIRHAHMVGITEEIMRQGMCADYNIVKRDCANIIKIVSKAKKIHITTTSGTDLHLEFDQKYRWCVSDADLSYQGASQNLPNGEVYSVPVKAVGNLVIDGTIASFSQQNNARLVDSPIQMKLVDGRVKIGSVKCKNTEFLNKFCMSVFETDDNSSRVGELGLGANYFIKELIGNILQDEKMIGVHLAFGDPYPKRTGADWISNLHLDCVIRNPIVKIDDRLLLDKNKYLL